MGCEANKKGKYEKGIEYFNRAINFEPNYFNAYINRGTLDTLNFKKKEIEEWFLTGNHFEGKQKKKGGEST